MASPLLVRWRYRSHQNRLILFWWGLELLYSHWYAGGSTDECFRARARGPDQMLGDKSPYHSLRAPGGNPRPRPHERAAASEHRAKVNGNRNSNPNGNPVASTLQI